MGYAEREQLFRCVDQFGRLERRGGGELVDLPQHRDGGFTATEHCLKRDFRLFGVRGQLHGVAKKPAKTGNQRTAGDSYGSDRAGRHAGEPAQSGLRLRNTESNAVMGRPEAYDNAARRKTPHWAERGEGGLYRHLRRVRGRDADPHRPESPERVELRAGGRNTVIEGTASKLHPDSDRLRQAIALRIVPPQEGQFGAEP